MCVLCLFWFYYTLLNVPQQNAQKKKKWETKFHEHINSGFIKKWNDGFGLFPKAFALSEMERVRMWTKCRQWVVMPGTIREKAKGRGSSKESDKGPRSRTNHLRHNNKTTFFECYHVLDIILKAFHLLFHIFSPNNFIPILQIWKLHYRKARAVSGVRVPTKSVLFQYLLGLATLDW